MSWAALALAVALLVGLRGDPERRLRRRTADPSGAVPAPTDDPLATAASLDVFAACLTAGMTVVASAAATAASAPPALAVVLRRGADLLALGADPQTAWAGGTGRREIEALLRLARRSAVSGAALARGVAELAEQVRADAADRARTAAERAGVLIAGPLGLCYLPAFVCLGIVPVVAGLASDVMSTGLW